MLNFLLLLGYVASAVQERSLLCIRGALRAPLNQSKETSFMVAFVYPDR